MEAAPTAALPQGATLGEKIHLLRRRERLTLAGLARRIGVDESTLSRYERDLRQPTADAIKALAEELGVSSDELLGVTLTPSSLTRAA
jgi:transcriptional regulator with XRE-family HTH domain